MEPTLGRLDGILLGLLSSSWPEGADGALSLNGTTAYIDAGDIKDYSSISIINNGELVVRGYSLGFYTNNGSDPTVIGCSGNCTINTGGKITARENALGPSDFGSGNTYSKNLPSGAALSSVSFTINQQAGGLGGESNGGGGVGGSDNLTLTGHGAGGGSSTNGGDGNTSSDWGASGSGGSGTNFGVGGGAVDPVNNGFSFNGFDGVGGEGFGLSIGGSGAGGTRGVSGGCIYLQVAGTLSVSGVVIDVSGSTGGNGGNGGAAFSDTADYATGGGGGGGGAGGSGGKVIVRYKLGSFAAGNCNVAGGTGGVGGVGGIATDYGGGSSNGIDGYPGSNGETGSTDIATY